MIVAQCVQGSLLPPPKKKIHALLFKIVSHLEGSINHVGIILELGTQHSALSSI